MNFKKILIPTDFSPASMPAFEMAAYSGKMEGAELILLHVRRLFEPLNYDGADLPPEEQKESEAYLAHSQKLLEELAEKYLHGQGVRCEVLSCRDNPAEAICEFAEREACDLILIASRGSTKAEGLLIGSIAQRVILLSRRPVLIVPSGERAR